MPAFLDDVDRLTQCLTPALIGERESTILAALLLLAVFVIEEHPGTMPPEAVALCAMSRGMIANLLAVTDARLSPPES